jgi:hypothetical protein
VFESSVRTAEKTQDFAATKINLLTLFREITGVYSDSSIQPTNTTSRVLIIDAVGTYIYRCALKG